MKIRFRNALLAMALAVTTVGPIASSFAQDDILNKVIPSVEYLNADLREVLKSLFKQVDANYSIAPEIQGTVTLSLKGQKFELVLQNILSQVDATYRYEGGVFVIVRRESNTVGTPNDPDAGAQPKQNKIIRKIYIRSADPMLIAMLIGNNSQSWSGSPEMTSMNRLGGGMMGGGMGGGMMGGGMGGGMMGGGMGGGMMGGGGMGGGGGFDGGF
jgi:hypothetical protein